jgi:hypothetical protein
MTALLLAAPAIGHGGCGLFSYLQLVRSICHPLGAVRHRACAHHFLVWELGLFLRIQVLKNRPSGIDKALKLIAGTPIAK